MLALPVLDMRLGFSDAGNRSEEDTTRRAYDLLSEGFGPGFNGPMLIVVDTPNGQADQANVETVAAAIAETEGVASVVPPQLIADANLAIINVFPNIGATGRGDDRPGAPAAQRDDPGRRSEHRPGGLHLGWAGDRGRFLGLHGGPPARTSSARC